MSTNRRDFIKFVVAGSVAAGCPIDLSLLNAQTANPPMVEGEDNHICHQVRDGKVFTRPPASAHRDVVIVGGGISGLTAAYLLRHHDFLLLEKEPHWGGNAYLMEYQGAAYATGSAFILQEEEQATHLVKEIGLEILPIKDPDGSILNGEWIADTWGSGLDKLPYPAPVRESFKKFKKETQAINVQQRSKELFNIPFADLLKGYPDELKQWWDAYGFSTYGAATDEAAAGIGVLELQDLARASEQDLRYTWPGGIGALSNKLAGILQTSSADRIQSGCATVAVVSDKNEVQVTYMQGAELKTVAAKAVIMASPKFITRRIVDGLPDKQSEAMNQIRYIPYAVVNLIFDKPVFNKGYDTWCPGNAFTDIVVSDWVVRNQPGYKQKYNILTCYTPLHEEERPSLLSEPSARRVAVNVLRDFQKLFPGSNVDPIEVHLYRRGHAMYMSTPGLYPEVQPLARQPMDRVFFANTDSEGPESTANEAVAAAQRAVKEVENRLAGKPMPKETAAAG